MFKDKKFKKYFYGTLLILFLNIWIVASWWDFEYGLGFGRRSIVDLTAIYFLPVLAFINFVVNKKKLILTLLLFLLICILQSCFLMVNYWNREIPWQGLSINRYKYEVQKDLGYK